MKDADGIERNEIESIQERVCIHVWYTCQECGVDVNSEDKDDTDGYVLAEALFDTGWLVAGGRLLCPVCRNETEAT